MKIKLTSIMVDNQDKALKFYTEIFGFVKKHDIPVGEYRWLTVVSPEGPDDLELSLEPNANPAGKTFQEAIFKQGIPIAAFEVDRHGSGIQQAEGLGVMFTQEPTPAGPVIFRRVCRHLRQPHSAVPARVKVSSIPSGRDSRSRSQVATWSWHCRAHFGSRNPQTAVCHP